MTIYTIITMVGDYPVENQPHWDKQFESLDEAIAAATAQHHLLADVWSAQITYHTIVVEYENTTAVWLMCGNGIYTGAEADKYAAMLEEQN